jgi:putative endonuclease
VSNLALGKIGEEFAINFLKENGYKILVMNYRSRLGEIDIIAQDKDTICFVEVKIRSSDRFGLPQESILRAKQGKICRLALKFLKENNLLHRRARFDVVSIGYLEGKPKFNLIKNAFELDGHFIY